jgi:hypothetical protein
MENGIKQDSTINTLDTIHKKLLSYRTELGLGPELHHDGAIDDLIFSHKWLAHQAQMVKGYMRSLEESGLLGKTDVESFDIFELFKAIDTVLLHREAMVSVIKTFDLEKEYDSELHKLLDE